MTWFQELSLSLLSFGQASLPKIPGLSASYVANFASNLQNSPPVMFAKDKPIIPQVDLLGDRQQFWWESESFQRKATF